MARRWTGRNGSPELMISTKTPVLLAALTADGRTFLRLSVHCGRQGSHGPLSPAGLASSVGWLFLLGVLRRFWIVVFCQGCRRRGRLGVRGRARRAQVWPARSGHRWVLEGGVVRMVTRGRLRAAVLLALPGLALSAICCAAPRVAAARTGPPGP